MACRLQLPDHMLRRAAQVLVPILATLCLAAGADAAETIRNPFYEGVSLRTATANVASAEVRGPVVPGPLAVVRNGICYAPAAAPENVKRAIWAINRLVGRPYKWGGGHGRFDDKGYDCSGTFYYALHHAGHLKIA